MFATSLFLWYWLRTRGKRTSGQWVKLGLLSGLMIDVYQLNIIFLLAVAYEVISAYAENCSARTGQELLAKELHLHGLSPLGTLLALLPTSVARQIVFGNSLS